MALPRIDLNNENQIAEFINEIQSAQFRHRQRAEYAGFEIYTGKLYEYVLNAIAKKRKLTWDGYTISSVNYMKKIVEKKAQAYKEDPIRKVIGVDGKENEEKTQLLNELYDEGKINESMRTLDISFNRARHALSWMQNDPNDVGDLSKFRLVPLDPFTFNVVVDPDTFRLVMVVLSYPDQTITHQNTRVFDDSLYVDRADGINQSLAESDRDSSSITNTYVFWTDEEHVRVRGKTNISAGRVETIITYDQPDDNIEGINPYGVLPFTWLTEFPTMPERPPLQPLYRESINMNFMRSELLTGAAIASTGILKMKLAKGDKPEDVTVGHSLVLTLEQPLDPDAPEVDADFINPNPNLDGVGTTFKEYVEDIAAENGLSGFTMTDGNKFNSGFERALAMADVTEVRKNLQKKYENVEKSNFEIIKAMDSANGTGMFDEEDSLVIIYKQPEILQTEMEQLNIIEKKDSMGVIREVDKITELNPNMDSDEAAELLKTIKEEKREKMAEMQRFLKENIPPSEDNDANNQTAINQEDSSI